VCTRRASDHTSSRSACLTWLRVSPPPASSGCAGDGFFEFPRIRILQRCRLQNPRVAPRFSTVLPRLSMQSSGLPEFCIFRLFRRWVFEFPRIPHPSAPPPVESPGFPVSSTLASPCDESSGFPYSSSSGCRRWFFEFPRVPHPSALPSSNLRVTPALRLKLRLSMIPRVPPVPQSSGCAGDGFPSFLESRILQRHSRQSSGFPRVLVPPASPADEAPGLPGSCIFRLRRR